jgi:glutaredoxin-like YruB-family protein
MTEKKRWREQPLPSAQTQKLDRPKNRPANFMPVPTTAKGEISMRIVLTIVTLLLSFSLAEAEMYQWIAEDGSVTFKDNPPPSRKLKKVKVYNDSDFASAPPQQPAQVGSGVKKTSVPASMTAPAKKERFSGTVEIYVTDWCGYCKQAMSYMKSKGIPYVAYNIEKDSSAKQRHRELGGRGVPLIIIGSNKMPGFSPEALEYYLSKSR